MTTALVLGSLVALGLALWYAYRQGRKSGEASGRKLAREAERDAERQRTKLDQILAGIDDDDLDRRLRLHERP